MKTKKGIICFGKGVVIFLAMAFIISMPAIFPHSRKVGLFLQAIGVIASAVVALFAIWGERIRARFFGPKLALSLFKPE